MLSWLRGMVSGSADARPPVLQAVHIAGKINYHRVELLDHRRDHRLQERGDGSSVTRTTTKVGNSRRMCQRVSPVRRDRG